MKVKQKYDKAKSVKALERVEQDKLVSEYPRAAYDFVLARIQKQGTEIDAVCARFGIDAELGRNAFDVAVQNGWMIPGIDFNYHPHTGIPHLGARGVMTLVCSANNDFSSAVLETFKLVMKSE